MGLFRRRTSPVRVAHPRPEEQEVVFRRSRTLTGSLSPQVSSSNESRAQLKTPRLKANELKKHRRLVVSGLVGTMLVIAGCVWLLDQYIVVPQTLTATRPIVTPVSSDDYASVVAEYLRTHPAERLLFLLNQQRLQAYVQEKRPEVAGVRIENASGVVAQTMNVTFRAPVAVWRVGDERLYVDASGVAYTRNLFGEPTVSVSDESGIDPARQRAIASTSLLRFIGQVVAGVESSAAGTVTQVTIPAGTLRELDLTLKDRPYRIKTNVDREAGEQVADIASIVRYLDERGIVPTYVDARVAGKAFYR